MKEPLISIVIPTKNSEGTLRKCLDSIKSQSYQNYELIIVDGHSTDATKEIASDYADAIFDSSEYVSGARNHGFSKANGDLFFSVDSDMLLQPDLLANIAKKINGHGALIVPEIGYGMDFLSRCKDLEKRCYIRDPIMEAARIFSRTAFESVNGYDPGLIFGEDWDIHERIAQKFTVGRVNHMLLHNTKDVSFVHDLRKAYKYGKSLPKYLAKKHPRTDVWLHPKKFFFMRHFGKLIKEPVYAIGLFFIKSAEYFMGFLGYISSRLP